MGFSLYKENEGGYDLMDEYTRKSHEKKTECETCDYHMDFAELLTTAIMDLAWIKRIGYVLIGLAGTFIVSVWAIFYPHLMSVNDRLNGLEMRQVRNIEKLEQLVQCDAESKVDRKELRKLIENKHP